MGVTQAFVRTINGIGKGARFSAGRVPAAAVVGGKASSLSGGKFGNGAVTGAFSRLFNDEVHYAKSKKFAVEQAKMIAKKKYGSMNNPDSIVRDGYAPKQEGLPQGTFVYDIKGENYYSLRASPSAATGYVHETCGNCGIIEGPPEGVSDLVVVDGNNYKGDAYYQASADNLSTESVYIIRPNFQKPWKTSEAHYIKSNGSE